MLNWVIDNGGWAFVLSASASASGFVLLAIWPAVSKYGRSTLGTEGEAPEFRTESWIAMMFSAGTGIGLMLYGVSEPLERFTSPPPGTDPRDAAQVVATVMATTMFHWTLHPWAVGDGDRDRDAAGDRGADRDRETAPRPGPARGSGRGHPSMTKGPLRGCSTAEGPLAGPGRVTS